MQVNNLKWNSKRFTPSKLRSFSRGDAYESCLPVARKVGRNRIQQYMAARKVTDPLTLSHIPPESQLNQWKDDMRKKQLSRPGSFVYAESALGRFDVLAIQDMLKLHTAKSIN